MPWLKRSPSDLQAVQSRVFSIMVETVPVIRGWFGLAVKRVNQQNKALSTASAIYTAISKSLGAWVHAIFETRQSMFLDPPTSFGSRWVEHVRNIYVDYGLKTSDLYKQNWRKSVDETQEEYDARIIGYANNLKQLFNKPAITKENIENSIKSLIGSNVTVNVFDSSSFVIPYPGPSQYRPQKFSKESDEDFFTRSKIYVDANFSKLRGGSALASNCSYPVYPEQVFSYNDYRETPSLTQERIYLLKNSLGNYSKNLDLSKRRYFNSINQGGTIVIEILDAQNATSLYSALEKIYEVKAAGVRVFLKIYFFAGVARKEQKKSVAGTLQETGAVNTQISVVNAIYSAVGQAVVSSQSISQMGSLP